MLQPLKITRNTSNPEAIEIEARRIKHACLPLNQATPSGAGAAGGGAGGSAPCGEGGSSPPPEPITSIPDGFCGLIQQVEATTYNLMIRAPYAGVITAVGGILGAGTCDIEVSIGATPLGQGETSLSTTYAEVVHTTDNVFAVNDIITMEITNLASSPEDLDFVLKMVRVL